MPGRQPGKYNRSGKNTRQATRSQAQPPRESDPAPAPFTDLEARFAELTPSEHKVLRLFVELMNDKQVASCLGTEDQTVHNQLNSIMHKLGAKSRAELISIVLSSNR